MAESIDTSSLRLRWIRAPWDEAVCPFPVMQIDDIEVLGADAERDMQRFEAARDEVGAGLVSCRLSHDKLKESMLLEACGFRFIEMLYNPVVELDQLAAADQDGLLIERARLEQMPALLEIAGSSFRNERFRLDHRLDPAISDKRYQNWVANTPAHPVQQLYAISEHGRLLAFFITELQRDGTCYWHLNAIAPDAQGQGYGRRVWTAMVEHARTMGARRVRTSVVARNTRVLSLYAKLGFTLPAPSMTFHWVRD
jgi:ribosomal protein S18 acetylase RimI-like enzyme